MTTPLYQIIVTRIINGRFKSRPVGQPVTRTQAIIIIDAWLCDRLASAPADTWTRSFSGRNPRHSVYYNCSMSRDVPRVGKSHGRHIDAEEVY
jgi:hypothetical protein